MSNTLLTRVWAARELFRQLVNIDPIWQERSLRVLWEANHWDQISGKGVEVDPVIVTMTWPYEWLCNVSDIEALTRLLRRRAYRIHRALQREAGRVA